MLDTLIVWAADLIENGYPECAEPVLRTAVHEAFKANDPRYTSLWSSLENLKIVNGCQR